MKAFGDSLKGSAPPTQTLSKGFTITNNASGEITGDTAIAACEKDITFDGTSTYESIDWFYSPQFTTTEQVKAACDRSPAGDFLSK